MISIHVLQHIYIVMSTNNQTQNKIIRQVGFPQPLFKLIKIRLEQLGISTPEYIRHLVIEDIKPLYKDIPTVDENTEESIGRALDDIDAGRVTRLKSTSQIKNHLNKIST